MTVGGTNAGITGQINLTDQQKDAVKAYAKKALFSGHKIDPGKINGLTEDDINVILHAFNHTIPEGLKLKGNLDDILKKFSLYSDPESSNLSESVNDTSKQPITTRFKSIFNISVKKNINKAGIKLDDNAKDDQIIKSLLIEKNSNEILNLLSTPSTKAKAYERLNDINATDYASVAKSIIAKLDRGEAKDLIKEMLTISVEEAAKKPAGTFLRDNSMSTSLVAAFANKYMIDVQKKHFSSIIESVDPKPFKTLENNQNTVRKIPLEQLAQKFLDEIIILSNDPDQGIVDMKEICHHVKNVAFKNGLDEKVSTMQGNNVFILRVVNPFLSTLSAFNTESIPKEKKENIMLVTKLLMNLGNEVLYKEPGTLGSKEPEMFQFNGFLKQQETLMVTLKNNMTTPKTSAPNSSEQAIAESSGPRRRRSDGDTPPAFAKTAETDRLTQSADTVTSRPRIDGARRRQPEPVKPDSLTESQTEMPSEPESLVKSETITPRRRAVRLDEVRKPRDLSTPLSRGATRLTSEQLNQANLDDVLYKELQDLKTENQKINFAIKLSKLKEDFKGTENIEFLEKKEKNFNISTAQLQSEIGKFLVLHEQVFAFINNGELEDFKNVLGEATNKQLTFIANWIINELDEMKKLGKPTNDLGSRLTEVFDALTAQDVLNKSNPKFLTIISKLINTAQELTSSKNFISAQKRVDAAIKK